MIAPTPKHLSLYKFLQRLADLPTKVLLALWILMIVGFAAAFYFFSIHGDGSNGVGAIAESPDAWTRFGNALYFSIITTTTVGFGDLTPLGYSKILAASEALLGFFLFAVLISKLVSQKQEIALYNVHRLAFQNAFSTTREGFFILRRDCDVIAAYAEEQGALNEKLKANLAVVLQKSQTLIEDILGFYDDFDWYNLDIRREALLLDAVHRTLERFVSLVRILDQKSPQWRSLEIAVELKNIIPLGASAFSHWSTVANRKHADWFPKIHAALDEFATVANA